MKGEKEIGKEPAEERAEYSVYGDEPPSLRDPMPSESDESFQLRDDDPLEILFASIGKVNHDDVTHTLRLWGTGKEVCECVCVCECDSWL